MGGDPMPADFHFPEVPEIQDLSHLSTIWETVEEWRLQELIQLADPGELAFVLAQVSEAARRRFFALAPELAGQPPAACGLEEIQLLWAGLS